MPTTTLPWRKNTIEVRMERKIRGLEDHETQERKRLFRDVRSPLQRLGDTLRLGHVQTGGIFAAGVCLFLFPSLSMPFFIAGLALFAARCVYVEDERLPFRMPLGLSGTDKGDPLPGRRGYARPEGIFFLGNRVQDQKELWLKAKDILTHCLLFGTTGSGKTETLVSLSYNALATGSGLFYIDPKASPKLAVQIWQMARFLGRDDDFRVLNYGTSGKVKGKTPRRLSNTNNPFTFGSAEALTQLLVSLMPASDGANSIFADKAQALISGVMYALVDLRDKGLLKLSTSVIRESLALEKCVALALRAELDEESRASIHAALGTCGWIAGREMKDQPQSFAEQFGYAQSYFGKALSSLTDTYSHIYGALPTPSCSAACWSFFCLRWKKPPQNWPASEKSASPPYATPVPWASAHILKATPPTCWKPCPRTLWASARICASWMNMRPSSPPALRSC